MTAKLLTMVEDPKSKLYLNIINNSAYHLMNVIEDALDMSRIENNKFEVNPEYIDIRKAIDEVIQIMDF